MVALVIGHVKIEPFLKYFVFLIEEYCSVGCCWELAVPHPWVVVLLG